MTKLSDTQLVILSAACQRDDRLALPLPKTLKGGAAIKVVGSLLAKKLVAEVDAKRDDPVWREADDGRVTLVATDAAFAALGIAPEDAPQGADEAPSAETANLDAPTSQSAPAARAGRKTRKRAAPKEDKSPRENKGQAMLEMLKRPEGATVAEIADAFGWQRHTARAAISVQTRKAGIEVKSEKIEGRGRVYRAD